MELFPLFIIVPRYTSWRIYSEISGNPSFVGTFIYFIYMLFFFLGGIPTTPIQHTKSMISAWRANQSCDPLSSLLAVGFSSLSGPRQPHISFSYKPARVCLVGPPEREGESNLTRCPCWIVCLPKQAARRDFFWMCWKELPVFSNEVKDK